MTFFLFSPIALHAKVLTNKLINESYFTDRQNKKMSQKKKEHSSSHQALVKNVVFVLFFLTKVYIFSHRKRSSSWHFTPTSHRTQRIWTFSRATPSSFSPEVSLEIEGHLFPRRDSNLSLPTSVNQDWLEGQCNGNTGIFPAAFVEELPANGQ